MMAKNYQKKDDTAPISKQTTQKMNSKDTKSKIYSSQDIRSKADSRFSKGNKDKANSNSK